MAESTMTDSLPGDRESRDSISIVQRGNLKTLEQTLRRQWRLGQNIVLCWSADERGVLVIFVPHYFLGNYCAGAGAGSVEGDDNEAFIRKLINNAPLVNICQNKQCAIKQPLTRQNRIPL